MQLKKRKIFKIYLFISLLFLQVTVRAQISETTTDIEAISVKQNVETNRADWAIGTIASFKPIKSVLIYDVGIQVSRSVAKGKRISVEAGYRTTAGSNFEQNFGNIPLSIKTDISSLLIGACYDYFPYVSSGAHGNVLRSLKLFGGVLYFSNPEYDFDAGLKETFVVGDYSFASEDVGAVLTKIKTNKIQPYLGIGYDQFYLVKNINFSINAGIMYHGKPEVSMVATKMLKRTAENAGRIEKKIENYQFMPLVQLLIQFNLI
jgi:hypothetical protein